MFLFACLQPRLLPASAAAPHLGVVLLLLLGLGAFRLVVAASLLSERAARLAAAAGVATLLGAMLAYYALVLIGLRAWGRVASWELIASYAPQAFRLGDALGVPAPALAGALLLAGLGLLAAAWLYLRAFDWAPLVRRSLTRGQLLLLAAAAAAFVAIELYRFSIDPPTRESEPFSLTFWPASAAWNAQGHVVESLKAERLDAAEDALRAAYRPATAVERRNVILIVVDALRPDHMGLYGYPRDTTPRLARLERAGLVRKSEAVRAACSNSLCGLLSLSASRPLHLFSERPVTLHEVLRRHGYRIHLILGSDHTTFYSLRKAYGPVDSYFDASLAPRERYLNDDRLVLERLADLPPWDGVPVMLQFHLMSAHALGGRERAQVRFTPEANYALPGLLSAAAPPREHAVNYYDNGVLQADAMIGEILDALGRKGYLDKALAVVTADHGEGLGEHGRYQHANSVFEEVLRVPFVLVSYGAPPARPLAPRTVASQMDIAPTLLAELGMPRPASWQGVPLHEPVSRDFLRFQQQWEAGLYDLRDPANLWKYWVDQRTGTEYAFNLTRDAGERRNEIESAAPPLRREWRRQLLADAPLGAQPAPGFAPLR